MINRIILIIVLLLQVCFAQQLFLLKDNLNQTYHPFKEINEDGYFWIHIQNLIAENNYFISVDANHNPNYQLPYILIQPSYTGYFNLNHHNNTLKYELLNELYPTEQTNQFLPLPLFKDTDDQTDVRINFKAQIPSEQVVAPGIYTSVINIRLYEHNKDQFNDSILIDQLDIPMQVQVKKHLSIESMPVNGQPTIIVKSNIPYTIIKKINTELNEVISTNNPKTQYLGTTLQDPQITTQNGTQNYIIEATHSL